MTVLNQMTVLFIVICIGEVANKKGIITKDVESRLSWIVLNIANPALIVSSGISEGKMVSSGRLAELLVVVVLTYIVLILFSFIISRVLRIDKGDRGAYEVMFVFSNIAFMGFPVISAIFGKEALIYASLFTLPYNILIYTYGVLVIGGDKKRSQINVSGVLNIGVIACIVSIILFALKLPMPRFMITLCDMLGGLSAPLSMMVIGSSLTRINFKLVFKEYKLIIFMIIKQVLFPCIASIVLKGIISDNLIYGICVIMLSMPVGSMTAMLANQYDGDYELVSKGVAITTIISVITIPIISIIARVG